MADYIDRQAAIDAMMKLQTEDIEAYGASIPEGFDGDRAIMALKALPSADVQPVHYAIWKLFSEYKRHWGKVTVKTFYCSHCGHEERIEHREFDDCTLPNFCSNCGYDMRWVD